MGGSVGRRFEPAMATNDLRDFLERLPLKQSHVLEHVASTSEEKTRAKIERQLNTLDLEYFCNAFRRAMRLKTKQQESDDDDVTKSLEPIVPDTHNASESEREAWRKEGYALIRSGKVGAIVMAGGQGTRLGTVLPKGTFDIRLPSGKSLFQLQAERIRRVVELAASDDDDGKGKKKLPSLPWYIMTSPQTHEQTVDFFRKHAYFNLPERDVVFFQQQEAPVFDVEGKLVLAPDGSIQTSPDGNGSIYRALLKSNALEDMKKRGVRHLHCYSVDNALILPADCEFVGYCALQGKSSGAKVIEKTSPEEKVGVFAREIISPSSSRIRVLEYSEIEPSVRDEREEVVFDEVLPGNMRIDDDSSFVKIEKYNRPPWTHFNPDNRRLRFRLANIANHYFSLEFLCKVAEMTEEDSMEYHVVEKDVPCYYGDGDNTAAMTKQRTKKAIKLESFIFDAYKYSSDGVTIFEGERKLDFAPVKRAVGDDSPESARRMISFLHSTWITKNGGRIQWGGYGGLVEVSPLVSLRGENLEIVKDADVQRDTSIELGWKPPSERQTPWHRYYGKHSSLA